MDTLIKEQCNRFLKKHYPMVIYSTDDLSRFIYDRFTKDVEENTKDMNEFLFWLENTDQMERYFAGIEINYNK